MTEKILTGIDVRSLFFPVIVLFFVFYYFQNIYFFNSVVHKTELLCLYGRYFWQHHMENYVPIARHLPLMDSLS